MSRYRELQPQVVENYSYLINLRQQNYKSWCLNSNFIPNNSYLIWKKRLKTTIVVTSRQRVNQSTTFAAFICTAWHLSNIWELKADIVCRYNTGVIYKTLNLTEINIFNFVLHFRRIVYRCECDSSLVPALLSSRAVLSVMYLSSILGGIWF